LLARLQIPLLLAVSAVMLLANLGNIYLWQDEAQTALVSRTILEHGRPLGSDGKNLFSQTGGLEYGSDYVWKWHPWLPLYVTAGSIGLLGPTTLAARLPFALMSVATIYFTFALARMLFGRRAAWAAALLLLSCVPFLLLSRQCRHYSPAMLFTMTALWGYTRWILRGQGGPWVYVLSLLALFHSYFPMSAIVGFSALVHGWIFAPHRRRELLIWSLGIGAVSAPFLFTLYDANYQALQRADAGPLRIPQNLGQYGLYLLRYGMQAGVLAGIVVILVQRFRKSASPLPQDRSAVSLLLGVVVVGVVLMAPSSYLTTFRDVGPFLPLLAILSGALVHELMNLHRGWAALPVLGALILSPLKSYLYEITHDFDGPIEGIVKTLNEQANPDDIVLISYGDLPVKYYTGLRVLGGMTMEPIEEAVDADWVIMRKHPLTRHGLRIRKYAMENLELERYERVEIPYPDTMFQNREDPRLHRYRTATDAENVVMLRRR